MIKITNILFKFIALVLGIEDNGNFPAPLRKDEENRLFEQMKSGDAHARDKIIEHNLSFVNRIGKKIKIF